MSAITFARGAAPKAAAKGGKSGGVVSAVVDAISGATGSGGCGNGTVAGKRGFTVGNKCHGNRNATVSAKQKAHTSANAVTRKHVKAGTLNTPAGRAAIKTAAKAGRELKDARDAHRVAQKATYAANARARRAAAKTTAATPAAQATAALKAAHAEANPVKAKAPAKASAKPAESPTAVARAEVATASKEATDIKVKAAAQHLADVHAGAASGRHDEAAAGKHIDRIARGHTKDELFAAAKAQGIEHSATTKKALVEHLKANAVPKADKLPLKDFASRVVKAAHDSPTGKFGDDQTHINHVHAQLQKTDPAFKGMSLDQFKGRLVEAHKARTLELGRADLVEAMNPADVKASRTRHVNAEYSFINHPPARGKKS